MPQTLFGILMLVVGVWSFVHVWRTRALLQASRRWSSTEGRVTRSKTKRFGNKKRTYEARIEYAFDVDGQEYSGKGLHIGGDVRRTRTWAEKRCAEYPEGSPVTVFYDPNAPASSCLVRAQEGAALGWIAGFAGIALGVALLSGMLG